MDPNTDLDPDPSIFVIDLQDANKKPTPTNFFHQFFCLLLKVHLHNFPKKNDHKEVSKQ
jgi:hypothetical protein